MAIVKRPCRVCGKLYVPCAACEQDGSAFHYREVACSYKCGAEYLRLIQEGRTEAKPVKAVKKTKKNADDDITAIVKSDAEAISAEN